MFLFCGIIMVVYYMGNKLDLNPLFSGISFALFQLYHVQSLDQAYF